MMFRVFSLLLFSAIASALHAQPPVEFNRDIRPILSDRCYYCHGPDEKTQEADLRLDTREGALLDGAIVPGKPEKSELFYRISTDDVDDIMPQPKAKKPKLTKEEIDLFRRWIEEGAEYQEHWAFEPLKKTEAPANEHPVDHFINARLVEEKIKPSPPADRATLIRRVYLDIIGLLPSREQVDAFIADKSPDAYEKVVDELLASRHYGERWGRHWLDGARYADSDGYAPDGARQMWPYRDWVIRALNDDMPFDQFTIEQIAGDLLPSPTKSQLVATGFHRNTLINSEGGSDPEQFRVEAAIDRTNTTGAVWLGLTVGCAQCHTHKFDPLKHREYYELYAFFNNAEDRNNQGATVKVAEGEMFKGIESSTDTPPVEGKPATWTPANYESAKTASGAAFHKQSDNSLLVDSKANANESYQIVSESELEKIAAVRLRTLVDKSLPKNGPGKAGNGNFVLTNIKILVDGKEQKIARAFADAEQKNYPVTHAFDDSKESGWGINIGEGSGKMNSNHEAVFVLAAPVATKGKKVEIRMFHDLNEDYLVGRFALDFADTPPSLPVKVQQKVQKKVTGNVMVMRDLKQPRESYILTRGDFTRPDKEAGKLTPGVFEAIAPAMPETDTPRNRLDLANWLIHPENPLTSRVTINRMWMRYFGTGLVETEEDFGSQGTQPSHPELLDFLARTFIEEGWSMKKTHKLIVTSETYKRSSKARPDLLVVDPLNILLARQSRIRLDAEIIRDVALSASGMLTDKIGGPGVHPPQPEGIYAFTQTLKGWKTEQGEDRYRRAMYTFFYRSAPYPLFGTFDTPDFQTTCTSRSRSNTPLQALNIANDEAFMEFAKGLAWEAISQIPGDAAAQRDARIKLAFERSMSRSPSASEFAVLTKYGKESAADFKTAPDDANALLDQNLAGGDTPPHEAAALVTVARAIFNTDNFITRE